jgi:sialic acid synthase SpsE
METIKKEFNLPTGYSDHTEGINIPLAAVALGACVIEKHFTLDKNLPGPDHKASLDPKELKEMVRAIRDVEMALGSEIKKPNASEVEVAKAVRKSIVAGQDIKKGEKIKECMIVIKRPGSGIKPKYLNKVLGRNAKDNIGKDELITFEKLL